MDYATIQAEIDAGASHISIPSGTHHIVPPQPPTRRSPVFQPQVETFIIEGSAGARLLFPTFGASIEKSGGTIELRHFELGKIERQTTHCVLLEKGPGWITGQFPSRLPLPPEVMDPTPDTGPHGRYLRVYSRHRRPRYMLEYGRIPWESAEVMDEAARIWRIWLPEQRVSRGFVVPFPIGTKIALKSKHGTGPWRFSDARVVFDNMTITGEARGILARCDVVVRNTTIRRLRPSDCLSTNAGGFYFQGCRFEIENCTFDSLGDDPVTAAEGSIGSVRNCRFIDCYHTGRSGIDGQVELENNELIRSGGWIYNEG